MAPSEMSLRSTLAARTRLKTLAARVRRRGWSFNFEGEEYRYVITARTRTNERTVELSLAERVLSRHRDEPVLEVGNVTSRFGLAGKQHVVVDKYERAPGVRNVDVVDLVADQKYRVVVSLSTLEHVGFDEDMLEVDKPLRAAEVLRAAVAPGGELLVTFPFAYNQSFDEHVRRGRLADPSELRFLKRVSPDNRWEQVDLEALSRVRYGTPFPYANGLGVWRWQKPGSSG